MFTTLLSLVCSVIMLSQISLSGNITDEKGGALQGAVIALKGENGNAISYTMSDRQGNFTLNVESYPEGSYIEISMLGYASQKLFPPFQKNINISLKEDIIEIEEVIIKAEKVSFEGDTTIFHAQGLVTTSDRNLSDVLKRLPGIDVSDDGYVQYHGKSIASLKIEGSDLLGSKYNIATKNLRSEDLKTIEVYENHQNVKALEGIKKSDDIVLNITLQEDAKNRWVTTLQAEGGFASQKPYIPYSASGLLMNIGKKFQTMTTLKTDAAGNDIISKSLYSPFIYSLNNYFSIDAQKAPLTDKRTRFNTTYAATNNTKFSLTEESTLALSASYNNDTRNSRSYIGKIYNYDNDSTISFLEDRNVRFWDQDAMAEVTYELNSKRLFINDKLSFQWRKASGRDSLTGSQTQIERASNESFDIGNNFTTIVRLKNKSSFNLGLQTQYSTKSAYYYMDNSNIRQDVNSSAFVNSLSSSFQHSFNSRWSLSITPSVNYTNRVLLSDLISPLTESDIKLTNNLRMNEISPKAFIMAEYHGKKLDLDLISQIDYNNYLYSGDLQTKKGILSTNTTMMAKIHLTRLLRLDLYGTYNLSPTSEQNLYNGVIMNNYKYLTLGSDNIINSSSYYFVTSLSYKEPVSGFNILANGTYQFGETHLVDRYFIDDFIVNQYSDELADFSQWSVNGKIEKTFYDIGSKVSISVNYSEMYSSINQNGIPYKYKNNVLAPKLEYNGNITRWMNIIYTGKYNYNRYFIEDSIDEVPNHTLSQELKLAFYPHRKVEINVSGEHYYNLNGAGTEQQMILFDCSAWYFITNKLQLFLHARNLLNEDTYSFTTIAPLETVHYKYNIRPLNVLIGFEYNF